MAVERNPDGTLKQGAVLNPEGKKKKFIISDYMTPDDVGELIGIAKKAAKEGNFDMIKYLLDHALGKPKQVVGGDETTPFLLKVIYENGREDCKTA